MYYVYILHSDKDKKLYTGFTDNLKTRVKKHEDGFIKATKHRRPIRLIHYEGLLEEADAKRREKFLKGGKGKKELRVLLKNYFKKHPWVTE